MQVTIPMQLSKTTKTKTVFATKDGLAPTSNVYVVTEYLTSRGIETKQCFVIISDVPFSDEECGRMLLVIRMRISRTTKYKTVFASADTDAPVESLYMVSDWLSSHGFGDALYLGVLDVASNCDTEDGANDSDNPEDISLDDTFDTFLEEVVVRRPGSRITTNHIRTAWAARHGADPTADTIAGIHKTSVARLFRAHFSAPPGKRGRAGGEVEYYWDGYAVSQGDAGA